MCYITEGFETYSIYHSKKNFRGNPMGLKIFVSHSHEDRDFCVQLVEMLQSKGHHLWFDDTNLESGQISPTIESEIESCDVFIVVLSPPALQSKWVEDECRWAYFLFQERKIKTILPIIAQKIHPGDVWLFMRDFKRTGSTDNQPYPSVKLAITQILSILHYFDTEAKSNETLSIEHEREFKETLGMGKVLFGQGDYELAIRQFDKATRLFRKQYEAWLWFGHTLLFLNRYTEAITALEKAAKMNPESEYLWLDLSAAYSIRVRYDKALEALDNAIRLFPFNPLSWRMKGIILKRQGKYNAALEAYRQCATLSLDDSPVMLEIGEILYDQGRFIEASGIFESVASKDKDNKRARIKRGLCLIHAMRYQEAYDYFVSLSRLYPASVLAQVNQGICLIFLRRFEEAQTFLEEQISKSSPHYLENIKIQASGNQIQMQAFQKAKNYLDDINHNNMIPNFQSLIDILDKIT
jgi:tetratricopeptide (TPR) repeat protein